MARKHGDHLRAVVPGAGTAGSVGIIGRVGIAGWNTTRRHLHRIASVNLAMADREMPFRRSGVCRCAGGLSVGSATVARRAAAVGRSGVRRGDASAVGPVNRSYEASIADYRRSRRIPLLLRGGSVGMRSAPPSDRSGNVPVVPGLGITPSGRGSQSQPDPGIRRAWRPARRPRRRRPGDGGDRAGGGAFKHQAGMCRHRRCCR